ncbi:MAG: hypothetical protein KAI64_04945 [Thermoplasmata archaeon]|nr:hypothetical protein [Thermoplasmata archaeon]
MEKTSDERNNRFVVALIAILLIAIMISSIVNLPWGEEIHEIPTKEVGRALFTEFWFAIVILGLLLAAALLGGIYLAKGDDGVDEKEDAK